MGTISLSLTLSGTEHLGTNTKFQVKQYLIDQKHVNYEVQTNSGVDTWTTLHPVTVVVLDGVFTSLVELTAFIAATKTSAVKTASNNIFYIKEDDVSIFPDTGGNNVLIEDFKAQSGTDISTNRWECVLTLKIDE